MPHQRKTNKRRMRRTRHRHTRKTSRGGLFEGVNLTKLVTGRNVQSKRSNWGKSFGDLFRPLPPKPAPTPITESGPVYDNRYPIEEYRKQLELYKNKKHHNKNRK